MSGKPKIDTAKEYVISNPTMQYIGRLLTASVTRQLDGEGEASEMMTTTTSRNGGGIRASLVLEWAVRVFALLAPILFGALLQFAIAGERRLDSHDISLAEISSNRFTAQDGADVQRQLGTMVTREELANVIDRWTEEMRELRRLVAENGGSR